MIVPKGWANVFWLPALFCSHGRAGRAFSWEEAAPMEEGLKRISTMFRKTDFLGALY